MENPDVTSSDGGGLFAGLPDWSRFLLLLVLLFLRFGVKDSLAGGIFAGFRGLAKVRKPKKGR